MSEYEAQAQKFLDKYGLTVHAAFKGDKCPAWDEGRCIHGDRYRVTIRRRYTAETCPGRPCGDCCDHRGRSITFDFWNSHRDMQEGKRPTAYDVLACISSDATLPTDPDELMEELGLMKVSQALASVRFTKRLQAFFSDEEIEALGEIR